MQPFALDPVSGLSVDSSAFRQRARVDQLSNDPDTATAQTVGKMCEYIRQASSDPWVIKVARDAVARFKGGPLWIGSGASLSDARRMAESVWWWCKHHLRFVHHDDMFIVWSSDLGDPSSKMQLLISPSVLLRMQRMDGDCAIYTMMIAAMLEALGLGWEICTGAVNAREPEIFSHVWPRLVLAGGGREPLDASHGKYPGWQVPNHDIYRLKVWDKSGREVANQAMQFSGLHAYRFRGGRQRWGMGALVCLDPNDTSSCYDDGSGSGGPITPPSTACTCVNGTCLENGNSCAGGATTSTIPGTTVTIPAGSVVVPNQNASNWAAAIGQLGKMGFTLAEIQAMQPGTVVNPNGQIIRQAPGYAVTPGGGGSSLSVTGGSLGGMLPILLIAGIGIFALMGSRR